MNFSVCVIFVQDKREIRNLDVDAIVPMARGEMEAKV